MIFSSAKEVLHTWIQSPSNEMLDTECEFAKKEKTYEVASLKSTFELMN